MFSLEHLNYYSTYFLKKQVFFAKFSLKSF